MGLTAEFNISSLQLMARTLKSFRVTDVGQFLGKEHPNSSLSISLSEQWQRRQDLPPLVEYSIVKKKKEKWLHVKKETSRGEGGNRYGKALFSI